MAFSNAKFTVKITLASSETLDLAANVANINKSMTESYTDGATSGKIDIAMSDVITLGAGANTEYDLDSGALVGIHGDTITFANVKQVYVENTGATNSLVVSGDFLGLSTDDVEVEPGGVMLWGFGPAGKDVTATTADVIDVASTSGTTYDLIIVGVST